jgi:hypothetical protein
VRFITIASYENCFLQLEDNMKYVARVFFVGFLLTSLNACLVIGDGPDWDEMTDSNWGANQRENREIISKLSIGSDRGSVVSLLGTPSQSEASVKEGDEYRVLYYRTQHRHSDGETSKDETTPLIFKNNKLIGWGEDAFSSIPK